MFKLAVSLCFVLLPRSMIEFAKLRADENCLLRFARFMAENQARPLCEISMVGMVKYAESSRLRCLTSSEKEERSVAAPVKVLLLSSIDMASVY